MIYTQWGEFDSVEQLQSIRPKRCEPLYPWGKSPTNLYEYATMRKMRQEQWYDTDMKPIPLEQRYVDFCRRLEAKRTFEVK
jgi:hypothetical protein